MNLSTNNNDYSEVIENDKAHVWHHLSQHKKYETIDPLVMIEGKGMLIWDANGKQYLDATSGGVWTVNVGYGRKAIADAVHEQLLKLNYFSNGAGSVPGSMFCKALIDKMPGMSRVYMSNSGSESNEKAFKIVRQIAHNKYGGKKNKIMYRNRDYHGSTIGVLSACGQNERRDQYGPFAPGFVEVPACYAYRDPNGSDLDFGDKAAKAIEEVILREGPDTIGAICLEPVTAGGGVITPPEGYWETVQEICTKYDILIHIDEVVCGLGRTGKWFGYQHYGIKPDLVTMAKGVASGYAAIACTVTTEDVFNQFKADPDDPMSYFRDISTFGGCTAGPAAALANMQIIEEENLLENVTKMGDYLMELLEGLKAKHKVIGDVRGKGLFCGLELVTDRESKEPVHESTVVAVVADCAAQGVLIGYSNRSITGLNNTICLSPALICTKSDMDQVAEAIGNALTKIYG